jgi:hypothetical protein
LLLHGRFCGGLQLLLSVRDFVLGNVIDRLRLFSELLAPFIVLKSSFMTGTSSDLLGHLIDSLRNAILVLTCLR